MQWITTIVTAALLALPQAHGQVAVTEFMVDPDGTDMGREWVELFNFSRVPLSLRGWTLEDQGSDVVELPAIMLPSAGYAVIVSGGLAGLGGVDASTAKAIFETEWLEGSSARVVGVEDMALANEADEIVLRDPAGTVVWAAAYADDDTPALATFLTGQRDFSINVYGSRGSPGVVRWGDDNGVPGFPGYEENGATRDPFAYESDVSMLETLFGRAYANVRVPGLASPLQGGYEVVPAGDVDWDGVVGVADFLAVLAAWGPCAPERPVCPADFDGSGAVGQDDLTIVLLGWTFDW